MAEPEWLTLHKKEWMGGGHQKMRGIEIRVLTVLDSATEEKAKIVEAELGACFFKAGFPIIYAERIPNEYWGKDPYALRSPWLKVTTRIGHFRVGWRKRVIELDFTETRFPRDHTINEVTKDDVTMDQPGDGRAFIHAWGYAKLEEYLRKMNELTSVR